MALPDHPGVYVLGSFARHVTIYSQQVRAMNLVDALFRTGQVERGTSVAVVGGGAAGLTAAAAAAWRGARVTVIEKEQSYLSIQRNSDKRFVHPHIYDWPLEQGHPDREDRADVPFLGWTADTSRIVFERMDGDWRKFVQNLPADGMPTELRGTFTGLECGPGCVRLHIVAHGANDPHPVETQVAILAVGFGLEQERGNYGTYWRDTGLDFTAGGAKRWLVSGFGDGALTDLLGLRINNFAHQPFVKRFAGNAQLADSLRALLSRPDAAGDVRAAFQKLCPDAHRRDELLPPGELRDNLHVTFNASPKWVESSGSSILNRFLVFLLEKHDAFTLQPGYVVHVPDPVKDRVAIDFYEDREGKGKVLGSGEFDRLVIRHGPAPVLHEERFPGLAPALKRLWERWQGLSQAQDPTRVPRWKPDDYRPDAGAAATHPDPWRALADPVCFTLVSTSPRPQGSLASLVKASVSGSAEVAEALTLAGPGKAVKFQFASQEVNTALRSREEYDRTVAMLCRAEIAVVDVTGFEPGIMLFLGIRAAARRGVTLVTINHPLDTKEWSTLPFNLKELYPVSVFPTTKDVNSDAHPTRAVGAILGRALAERAGPHYHDLPAWEAVRHAAEPAGATPAALWLCSFSPGYQLCESYITQGWVQVFGAQRLERTTEIASPQLVTRRLYGAIRHGSLCLVDWTFWSRNVFFELGVRLAVSPWAPSAFWAPT